MLRLNNVKKSFADKKILESVTISMMKGDLLCLTGPSGIGKSTMLEIMAGVQEADSGIVMRDGSVALAFQDDLLIPWLTAAQNMSYALPSGSEKNIHGTLHDFGLSANMYPSEMSGGMRRRLNMARAFAANTDILLLDEPFAFLDEEWQKKIAKMICYAAKCGKVIALSSHNIAPLSCFAIRNIKLSASPVII